MGSWGSGPFDNDDAADFAGEVSDTREGDQVVAHLEEAMTAVTNAEGYIEAPEMNSALAAAALVALFADPALPIPISLDQSWVESVRFVPPDHLIRLAARVFTRALDSEDNEWFELWNEAELVDEVEDHLTPYSSALD